MSISIVISSLVLSSAQTPLAINKDTLAKSLVSVLETKDSSFRKQHFLYDQDYDYYNSINSTWLVNELSDILDKINCPFRRANLEGITFVKCHNWVEAYSTWYITIIDSRGNHYLYFYENNRGEKEIPLHSVNKEKNYVLILARNLLASHLSCDEKNEDYIIIGEVVNSQFTAFVASQIFHRMDMVFFYNLLDALRS